MVALQVTVKNLKDDGEDATATKTVVIAGDEKRGAKTSR